MAERIAETFSHIDYADNFENAYRKWVRNKVDPSSSFTILMDILDSMEFRWTVDNDENREEDGRDLRLRFEDESGLECPDEVLQGPCSVLEMLFSLSIRMEDSIMYDPDIGDRYSDWFWVMLDNLGVAVYSDRSIFLGEKDGDPYVGGIPTHIEYTVRRWMDREYDRDGTGGIFPIPGSEEDQRKVEIWYQMMDYVACFAS